MKLLIKLIRLIKNIYVLFLSLIYVFFIGVLFILKTIEIIIEIIMNKLDNICYIILKTMEK